MTLSIGKFLKIMGGRYLMRVYHPLRMIFDIFDKGCLNSDERENRDNVIRFKGLIQGIVDERRKEMSSPDFNYKDSYDFLTQLLGDEIFKNDESMIMDECLNFIGAATQTTSFLTTNLLYYLIKNPEVKAKLQEEIKTKILPKIPQGSDYAQDSVWQDLFCKTEIFDSCPYLLQCIYEALRI